MSEAALPQIVPEDASGLAETPACRPAGAATEALHRRSREAGRPIAFRGGGFEPRPHALVGWLVLAGLVALWQVASSAGWVSPLLLPSPVQVASALRAMVGDPNFAGHARASLGRVLSGLVLGTALGLVVGCAMGIFSLARAAALPVISGLYRSPREFVARSTQDALSGP